MKKQFVILGFLGFFSIEGMATSRFTEYAFEPSDISCGGFPKLPVTSFQGSCVGLVASSKTLALNTKARLQMPRKVLELEPGRLLVTDMTAWDQPYDRGVLWEIDLREKPVKLIVRGTHLQTPHDIQFGPDGNIYIGERGRITRWNKEQLRGHGLVQGVPVIDQLLANFKEPKHLHPLMEFAFGKTPNDQGDLYLNMGAPSDACLKEKPNRCTIGDSFAQIRKFKYDATSNAWSSPGIVYAKGLRNSVGLVIHPSGTFLQVENSRDFKNAREPFDELNVILPNKHYGWPYCFDFTAASPEWSNISCRRDYEAPYLLIPPHAAPLDLIYYKGSMFPKLDGHLLISWHGHEATGSRLVAYKTDARGLPVLLPAPTWSYNEWTASGPKAVQAHPEGENLRGAHYEELISVWNERAGARPSGRPVGLTVGSDGSIFVVEDLNHTILILTKSSEPPYHEDPGTSPEELARIRRDSQSLTATPALQHAFEKLNKEIFQPVCASCHFGIAGSNAQALSFLVQARWVLPKDDTNSKMVRRIRGLDGKERMPKGGALTVSEQQAIQQWIRGAL